MTARVRLYVSTSIDGFIADADGGVDWLEPYQPASYGYQEFMQEVGTVVIGRRTFEQIATFGERWPYAEKRSIIVASQPLRALPPNGTTVLGGIAAAVREAREQSSRDVWVLGGAVTMRSAIDAGLVDFIDIFVVPVLLGRGISLLGSLHVPRTLDLDGITTYQDGVVKLRYNMAPKRA